MSRIGLEGITRRFGGVTALRDINLDIADGEFFVLLGPTGAGKTTMLRLVAGLEKPTEGHVLIDGVNVNDWGAAERDVALVLQQYSLYPRYTVRENLEFPLKSKIRRLPQDEIDARVERASRTLRIGHLLDRKTDRLSGGEMQRVSIGRAIVREPRVFLMDEPLSALDAKLRESLRSELKDLQRKLRSTFIFVTHDQVEAMSMGDRVAVLNKGRIIQIGTPQDIYSSPRNTYVASFVGSPAINLLQGRLNGGNAVLENGALKLPLGKAQSNGAAHGEETFTFGFRPEDVHLEAGAPGEARVHDIENHGVEKIVTLRLKRAPEAGDPDGSRLSPGETLIRATVPAQIPLQVEEPVRFAWNPAKVMLFDRRTGVNLRHEA